MPCVFLFYPSLHSLNSKNQCVCMYILLTPSFYYSDTQTPTNPKVHTLRRRPQPLLSDRDGNGVGWGRRHISDLSSSIYFVFIFNSSLFLGIKFIFISNLNLTFHFSIPFSIHPYLWRWNLVPFSTYLRQIRGLRTLFSCPASRVEINWIWNLI